MKANIVFACFLMFAAVCSHPAVESADSSLESSDPHVQWFTFKAKYGKEYAHHEEGDRKAVFLEHARAIEEHNVRFRQGLESFEMGHNKLSDLTIDEIKQTRMGLVRPPNADEIMANMSAHVVPYGYIPPASFDWRKYNAVSPVKDQENCNSCYIFATAAALESAHWRRWRVLPDISEQDLLDCSMRYGNSGCMGGWITTTLKWVKDNDGYVAEKDDPYKGKEDQCLHESTCKIAKVFEYKTVNKNDEAALMHAVATVGPVATGFHGSNRAFTHYKSGIIDAPDCNTTRNHAGLIVGYGTENNTDFWIVKNSWADDWGEDGYFRIKRGVNMCGIAEEPVYVLIY